MSAGLKAKHIPRIQCSARITTNVSLEPDFKTPTDAYEPRFEFGRAAIDDIIPENFGEAEQSTNSDKADKPTKAKKKSTSSDTPKLAICKSLLPKLTSWVVQQWCTRKKTHPKDKTKRSCCTRRISKSVSYTVIGEM